MSKRISLFSPRAFCRSGGQGGRDGRRRDALPSAPGATEGTQRPSRSSGDLTSPCKPLCQSWISPPPNNAAGLRGVCPSRFFRASGLAVQRNFRRSGFLSIRSSLTPVDNGKQRPRPGNRVLNLTRNCAGVQTHRIDAPPRPKARSGKHGFQDRVLASRVKHGI